MTLKHRTRHIATAAFVCLSALFASCGSDDDNQELPTPSGAMEMAGDYSGIITYTVMGNVVGSDESASVAIVAEDENKVSVTLPAFTYTQRGNPMTLPAITVGGLEVARKEGSLAVGETRFEGATTLNGAEKTYSGVIAATQTNGQIDIDFSLLFGAMPLPNIGKFLGTKKAQ